MSRPAPTRGFRTLCARVALLVAPTGSLAAQTLVDLLATSQDRLGQSVHPAGDFDGDGFPDALVTANQLSKDEALPTNVHGAALILSGRDGRLLFARTGDDYTAQTGIAISVLLGTGPFAENAAMIGDLDGDGTCDVLVVHGSSRVQRKITAFSGRTGVILWTLGDPYGRTTFGDVVVGLGDLLDAGGQLIPDGVPDFAVGAARSVVGQGVLTYPGLVHIYSGANAANGPVRSLVGNAARVSFGASLLQVPDLDGDGFPALAVGAPSGQYVEFFDGPFWNSWSVLPSPYLGGGFGQVVAELGDLDGDGRTEIGVSDAGFAGGRGTVLVYTVDPAGAVARGSLLPETTAGETYFGADVASLPRDPMTGSVLLDLDHDGTPDPFLDWNHDGIGDFLVGARGYETITGSLGGAGAVYLLAGTGSYPEIGREIIQQGFDHPQLYTYLGHRQPAVDEAFGSRVALLGNPSGESQLRLAIGTPLDEARRGGVALLRPPLLGFDDDTFSVVFDTPGTSRQLRIDCGPRHAGQSYHVLASASGANPGQIVQGFRIPLENDGPGGLWERTLAGGSGGTPLSFSQLEGVLDAQGRATITVTVTGPTAGHPWFTGLRQNYVVVLERRGQPGRIATVSAPAPLTIF